MPKEIVSTDAAPKGLAGYSQAVKANGLVFVSGQGPFDPATGDVVGETIQEQTRQCLRNVEAILKAAGSSIDSVVQATFILDDESDSRRIPHGLLSPGQVARRRSTPAGEGAGGRPLGGDVDRRHGVRLFEQTPEERYADIHRIEESKSFSDSWRWRRARPYRRPARA
jgi:reactive intermediate/imine deaminase